MSLKYWNRSHQLQLSAKLAKEKTMLPTNSVYFVKMTSMSNQKRNVLSAMSMSRSFSSRNITTIVYLIVRFSRKRSRNKRDFRKKSLKDTRDSP